MEQSEVTYCWNISANNLWQADDLIALLDDMGIEGFEENDNNLKAYAGANEDVRTKIEKWLTINAIEYSFETIASQNWNAVWESNFEPLFVADKVYLRAHFHPHRPEAAYEIEITPKMSFGTGHHATTRLMIEGMLHLDMLNKTVLDFGTGTGVLAILAEKLGAGRVSAIDNDNWSYENANENAQVNGCSRVEISIAEKPPKDGNYDIVLANINLHVLIANAEAIAASLDKEGLVLVSGIYAHNVEDLNLAFKQYGLVLEYINEAEGWVSVLFHNT